VIARLAGRLPQSLALDENDSAQEAAYELLERQEMNDRIYGMGRWAKPEAEELPPPPPPNPYALEECMPGLRG
jgi:hypothetical protein